MIRPAGTQDLPFLRDMLRHAYYARWSTEADVPLERYVAGWGRPGDTALIAIEDAFPVGAGWYRLFRRDQPGYGFVDEDTPELAIAVVPNRRGRGIGDALLDALFDRARADGYRALSLSVARDNDALLAFYRKHGFERVAEDGGDSVTMRLLAKEPEHRYQEAGALYEDLLRVDALPAYVPVPQSSVEVDAKTNPLGGSLSLPELSSVGSLQVAPALREPSARSYSQSLPPEPKLTGDAAAFDERRLACFGLRGTLSQFGRASRAVQCFEPVPMRHSDADGQPDGER